MMKVIAHLSAVSGQAEISVTVPRTLTALVWEPSWASSCRRGSEKGLGTRPKGVEAAPELQAFEFTGLTSSLSPWTRSPGLGTAEILACVPLCRGAALCVIGCSAAPLVTARGVSGHGQMCSGV